MPNILPDHMQDRVRALLDQGMSRRAIARDLLIAKGTVDRYAHDEIIGYDLRGHPVFANRSRASR